MQLLRHNKLFDLLQFTEPVRYCVPMGPNIEYVAVPHQHIQCLIRYNQLNVINEKIY